MPPVPMPPVPMPPVPILPVPPVALEPPEAFVPPVALAPPVPVPLPLSFEHPTVTTAADTRKNANPRSEIILFQRRRDHHTLIAL
jgi:hypothetical protein